MSLYNLAVEKIAAGVNRLQVSMYFKTTNAGDTAIDATHGLPVTVVGAGTGTVDTELPAAAALADAAANPTTPTVGAGMLGYNGTTWDRVRLCNVQYDLSAVSVNSIATVGTPTTGKKLRLLGGSISVSAAGSVLFEDNAGGTTVYRTPKLLADTPYNFVVRSGQGYMLAAINNVLKGTGSVNMSITGTLFATEE